MSETAPNSRRTSLRLFGTPNTSEQTTPVKRRSSANENIESDVFGLKRQRRSSVIPGKSILKSPGRGKSPARVNLASVDNEVQPVIQKASVEKKNFPRKSLGRRVSFAQTAHIRLFEKDAESWNSPDKSRDSDSGFGFSDPPGNFAIPDLSSVRRASSSAFNLRLSLPKATEDVSVDSEESSARSFEIAVKGGTPDATPAKQATESPENVNYSSKGVLFDMTVSTIESTSVLHSSLPTTPNGSRKSPRLSNVSKPSYTDGPLSFPRRSSGRLSLTKPLDEDVSEDLSMDLVEGVGKIEDIRRLSLGSKARSSIGGRLSVGKDDDSFPVLPSAMVQKALSRTTSGRPSLAESDDAMEETNPIGGIISRPSFGGNIAPIAPEEPSLTESTEMLQKAIADATSTTNITPIVPITLTPAQPVVQSISEPASVQKPMPTLDSPRRASLRSFVSTGSVNVSPLRRRASLAAAIQAEHSKPVTPSRLQQETGYDSDGDPEPDENNTQQSLAFSTIDSISRAVAKEIRKSVVAHELGFKTMDSNLMDEEFTGGDISMTSADGKGPMTLKDFLRATGMNFMDNLITASRRSTNAFHRNSTSTPNLVDYVKVNLVEVPELELFEFGCKELVNYIAQGKASLQKIDQDASQDNPLLFLEFQEATEQEKEDLLTNLRDTKSFARLVAKEAWYTWREKLLEGFITSLQDNTENLHRDQQDVAQFDEQMAYFVPEMKKYCSDLTSRLDMIRNRQKELEQYDKADLIKADQEIEAQKQTLAALPTKLAELKQRYEAAQKRKQELEQEKVKTVEAIRQAQQAKDQLKLVTTDEAKSLYDEYQLFTTTCAWKASPNKPLTFLFEELEVTLVPRGEGVRIMVQRDNWIKPSGYKMTSIKDKQKLKDATVLHDFFLSSTVARIEAQDLKKQEICQALEDLAHNWTRLKILKRDVEEVRLMNPVQCVATNHGVQIVVLFTNGHVETMPTIRFTIAFELSSFDCHYPFGPMRWSMQRQKTGGYSKSTFRYISKKVVFEEANPFSEEKVRTIAELSPREFGRLVNMCREINHVVEPSLFPE